jgi:hypothetical protein
LGISIIELLNLELVNQENDYLNKFNKKSHLPKRDVKTRRPFNIQKTQQALESLLNSQQYPPPSMMEVAKLLEYDPRFLRKHFSDLCRAISAKYINYQEASYKKKIEQLCIEVRQAVIELHAQGQYPSNTRVSMYLKQPGAIRNKDVRAVLEQVRCQLGVGKNKADD